MCAHGIWRTIRCTLRRRRCSSKKSAHHRDRYYLCITIGQACGPCGVSSLDVRRTYQNRFFCIFFFGTETNATCNSREMQVQMCAICVSFVDRSVRRCIDVCVAESVGTLSGLCWWYLVASLYLIAIVDALVRPSSNSKLDLRSFSKTTMHERTLDLAFFSFIQSFFIQYSSWRYFRNSNSSSNIDFYPSFRIFSFSFSNFEFEPCNCISNPSTSFVWMVKFELRIIRYRMIYLCFEHRFVPNIP